MSRRITSTYAALSACLLALSTLIFHSSAQLVSSPAQRSGTAGIIINEVDSDTPGSDVAEFVELYDGGVGNTPLDGYVVVFFNGGAANDPSYAAFDLDGFATNASGYFTLGNSSVSGVDLVFSNAVLQNGADAVALFAANASNFPNGTAVTTAGLIDALVYDTTDADDPGLLVLLNAAEPQIDENANGNADVVSMQRLPNGSGGERNTASYQLMNPTPDGPNLGPTAAAVSLSGRAMDSGGIAIYGARILIEGGGLSEPRMARTGPFGYYGFDGLPVGTYLVTINSKRHIFATPSRVITLNDSVQDFNFVAEPHQ